MMAPNQQPHAPDRRFSQPEAERILRDAAALEHEADQFGPPLSLTQLREIAGEAQIPPEFVDRAIGIPVRRQTSKRRNLLCGLAAGTGLVTGVNTALVLAVGPAAGVGVMLGGTVLGAGVGLVVWRQRQHPRVQRLMAVVRAVAAHPQLRRIWDVLGLEPRIVLEPRPPRDRLPPA